ncbi:peroxisomal membrane protein PMP34 isoform X2 [Ctenocephalides felis]|uniref:peroxisomal membrane protein PMP34 isoform X2 n=1 Tax=Ctenocephalides felis TaxID=7515 RepID=UPI000E6E19CD|nr:peroxisomal membrane protein PMP34 isoform X2 [Ctenocephalides felis]
MLQKQQQEASVVAMATFYPLDTLRSRLQLEESVKIESKGTFSKMHKLIENEGFETLYRGMIPVLKSLCASNFVYFYTFHGLKRLFHNDQQTALKDLFLGMVAGACNVMVTTPLWVVNTRLKMKGIEDSAKDYEGLLDGLIKISKEEGIFGLWAGAVPSLILVINPAIQFMTYESIKRRLLSNFKEIPSSAYFALGAFSKIIATCLTYPLQLVQTKLRHGRKGTSGSCKRDIGIFHMFKKIIETQGIPGLFRGLEAKLLHTVLTVALMFAVYEKITTFVLKLLLRKSSK